MERLGTRHFHPSLTEIFDVDCSHSGSLDTPFLSSNIYTGLCSFAVDIHSIELVPHPAIELCFHLPWSKECRSMARAHRILVGYWTGFSSRNASLYRQLPAWAASGSHRTRSKYRAGLAVDIVSRTLWMSRRDRSRYRIGLCGPVMVPSEGQRCV